MVSFLLNHYDLVVCDINNISCLQLPFNTLYVTYAAVQSAKERLLSSNFKELIEAEPWALQPKGKVCHFLFFF